MIRSMITSMIRPMIRPMIGGDGAITRFFAEFDSVLNSHLVYANTLVFTSGDTYKCEFLAPNATVASNETITDGDNTGNPALFELASDGTYNIGANMTVTVGGVAVTGASSYPTDGKLYEYEFTFTGAARIKFLGKNEASSNFYNGIFANLVATISGVTTTNPLGLATGNVEYSDENMFGPELWSNPPSSVGSDWVDNGGGSYSYFGDGSFNSLQEVSILEIGKSYKLTFNVMSISGEMRVLSGSNHLVWTTTGFKDVLFTADGVSLIFARSFGIVNCELNSVTIKEVEGNALTYVNIPEANREQFQLSDDTTQWDNISDLPQELPSVIEVAS